MSVTLAGWARLCVTQRVMLLQYVSCGTHRCEVARTCPLWQDRHHVYLYGSVNRLAQRLEMWANPCEPGSTHGVYHSTINYHFTNGFTILTRPRNSASDQHVLGSADSIAHCIKGAGSGTQLALEPPCPTALQTSLAASSSSQRRAAHPGRRGGALTQVPLARGTPRHNCRL